MSQSIADPLVGKTIAQYDVVARLGGGGMGVVYRARDTKLGRSVALKFLPPQWSHDESAKQRFIREAQAASATDHRNICTIHDIASTDDGQLFIVMAFYDGQTLKQKLEAGPLPTDEAIEIAAQLAEGLAKAHGQGVVHRDIKPGNVIVTDDAVKILDFGLAKFADVRFKLTLEGSTLGTIAYMSPEQARGDEADARSDVWAVGVVLYEMLTGSVPFKGGYPEAISHAIKNDTPAPLRGAGRDIPEALEQIVFRALHKEPNVRFQSARDLARALRLLQGRTLPVDLSTEPLDLARPPSLPGRTEVPGRDGGRGRGRRWRTAAWAAAAVVVVLIGTPLWIFSPVERVPVAVAPVVNQTGDPELDAYRLALTQELTDQLAESRSVRVLPYERLLQIVRRFRVEGTDVSSREAIQAISTQSGARVLIIPTLLYENGAWKARAEFRDPATAINEGSVATTSAVSSLKKDMVYGLMAPLAASAEDYFLATGPRRARLAGIARRAFSDTAPLAPRLRGLDAAAASEQGIDAYERQEYSEALRAFTAAAGHDPRNALLSAWRSRVAQLMRRDDEAMDAADQAARLVTDQIRVGDRMLIEAVVAESRRDFTTAESRYRELAARFPDEPAWVVEHAAFLDRRTRTQDAIGSYQRALSLDPRLARPDLDLCRLYGASNESAKAKEHAVRALAKYRALGERGGEALTLLCLTNTLRVGSAAERDEATRGAEDAGAILAGLHYSYNLPRVDYFLGMIAGRQRRMTDAVTLFERSLKAARDAGNRVLEPIVLTNLGVADEALGNRSRAADHYRQSYQLFEKLGDESRAARSQANRAALLVEYGGDPADGLRDAQNALGVFQKLGDKNFQVFCMQLIAAHHRYAGRHDDAQRELNRAMAIARERGLNDLIASLSIDLARSRAEVGDYSGARTLLSQVVGDGSGPFGTLARIRLGIVEGSLGELKTAATHLAAAASDLEHGADAGLRPLLHLAQGLAAYETGQFAAARAEFDRASTAWTDDQPDAASVEARAYLGLVDAEQDRVATGRRAVQSSLDHARRIGRIALEARCRMLMARLDIGRRQFKSALDALNRIPPDDGSRTIGQELRAEVHYWRSRALAGLGDQSAARAEADAARTIVEALRAPLSGPAREAFSARQTIRLLHTN